MVTVINEIKTLTKHVSCECKCKSYDRKCNSDQKWNEELCKWECKNVITCDNVIEATKTTPTNFIEKNETWKITTSVTNQKKLVIKI